LEDPAAARLVALSGESAGPREGSYDPFAEGFATADLQGASAMIDEVSTDMAEGARARGAQTGILRK
jgi:hypothetical protein